MKPLYETIHNPDSSFPMKSFIRSSLYEHVFVHPHWHREIEILYVMEGSGFQQIGDNYYKICKGDIVIIDSGRVHSTYTDKEFQNDILVIHFSTKMLIHAIHPFFEVTPSIDNAIIGYSGIINSGMDTGRALVETILNIHREFEAKENHFRLFIRAYIYEIAGLIRRNLECTFQTSKSCKEEKVKEMLKNTFDLIDKHYVNDISLSMAADASSLSVSHFCRVFRKYTGITFKNYLSMYRIEKATGMLKNAASITEISFECGFGSVTSFIREFKKYKGCTPSTFRNRH